MNNQTDRPGVVILPPLLMVPALVVVLALHWLWPLPIGLRLLAVALGIILGALGIGSAAWGHITLLRC